MRNLAGTGPGGYLMGDSNGRTDERPVHRVILDPFAIGIWPVCNKEYAAFLVATARTTPPNWGELPFNHPNAPVCGVSWYDAVAYGEWLSNCTGHHYHLPTEAQREFATRGGDEQQAYPWGNDPRPLTGPYQRGLHGLMVGGPMPVLTSKHCPRAPLAGANRFGLYHMADNVHEWCSDYYGSNYYTESDGHNPCGPKWSDRRVARGGSWRHDIKYCRSAARSSLAPDKHFADFGFRIAASDGFEYVS